MSVCRRCTHLFNTSGCYAALVDTYTVAHTRGLICRGIWRSPDGLLALSVLQPSFELNRKWGKPNDKDKSLNVSKDTPHRDPSLLG